MRDEEKLDLIGCGVNIGSRWSKQNTIAELENIKAEITEYRNNINAGSDEFHIGRLFGCDEMVEIIDKHISELKGSD